MRSFPKKEALLLSDPFSPQTETAYGFDFAREKDKKAINEARSAFHADLAVMDVKAIDLTSILALFQKAKKASDLLEQAKTELEIRQAFEDEKTDLAKDLVTEQPLDVVCTLLSSGINVYVDAKKLKEGDFSGVVSRIKRDIENAVMTQVTTAMGIDPAVVAVYDTIRSIKTIKSPEDFLASMTDLGIFSGTALIDIVNIVKISGKKLIYPEVPKKVLLDLEKYITRYQDENAKGMSLVVDKAIDILETFSNRGLLPEDKKTRDVLIMLVNDIRHYVDELKKQVRIINNKLKNSAQSQVKALTEKIAVLENQIQLLEEKCRRLRFWKNLSNTLFSDSIHRIESGGTGTFEDYLGMDIRAWAADRARTVSEKFDLKRALDANPEITMAARTYDILNAHVRDKKRKRDWESFETIHAEAEFLIALEAQQRRGLEAVRTIASQLKFSFQSRELHNATLSANHFLLNDRKLAVAEALLKSFHLPMDQDAWKAHVDFTSFYEAINQEIFGKKALSADPVLKMDVRAAARAKSLSLVNTLDRLKSNGMANKDLRHNEKIKHVIQKLIDFYSKTFSDEKIIQDKATGEWLCVAEHVDVSKEENKSDVIQAKIQQLLGYAVSDAVVQQAYLAEIQAHYSALVAKTQHLFVWSTDAEKAEKKEVQQLEKQWNLLQRIYRHSPRENIIQKEQGEVSPLGLEVAENINGYFARIKTFEIERHEKIAKMRAQGINAFDAIAKTQSGVFETMSTNLRKKIEKDINTADLLNTELVRRHEAIEAYVKSASLFSDHAPLNPRAAYLADMTPEALTSLINSLAAVENRLSQKDSLLVRASSKIEDFLEARDLQNEQSLMSVANKQRQLNDVKATREEIAITMYERLQLAEKAIIPDLVAKAGLIDTGACEAYRLSSEQLAFYHEFIQRYGTLETQTQALQELKPIHQLLEKLSMPIEKAWVSYQVARLSADNDLLFTASENFAATADFLLEAADRDALLELSKNVGAAQELLRVYDQAISQQKIALTPEEERIYLRQMGLTQHPTETLRHCKDAYCKKVSAALSPSKMISTEWGKTISTRKTLVENKLRELEKTHQKSTHELSLKKDKLKKRLDTYNASTGVGKFFRSVTVSFKLGIPPVSFSRSDNEEKRARDLYFAESQLADDQANYLAKKSLLEAEKNQIDRNAKQIAQHLINTIRLEIKDAKIAAPTVERVRAFVTQHAPESLAKLSREVDFVRDFIGGLLEGEPAVDLKMAVALIKKFDSTVSNEARFIFDLINGQLPVLEEGESLKDRIDACLEKLLSSATAIETEQSITKNGLVTAIRSYYLEPLVIRLATKNAGYDLPQLTALLTLFTPQTQSEILEACITVTKETPACLFSLFEALPAFSKAKSYADSRDRLFQDYFESRLKTILAMVNDSTYDSAAYEQDLSVFIAADRAGSTSVADLLEEAVSSALLIPQDGASGSQCVWNENLARLVEAYAKPRTIAAYRLLRLNELCADEALQGDEEKAQLALKAFVDSMKKGTESQIDQAFIDALMNNDKPSWIAEAIVLQFGSAQTLQTMHTQWVTAAIKRMSSKDYEETDNNESVLQQLIEQRTQKTDFEKLENFVGQTGIEVVREGLEHISKTVAGVFVEPVGLTGDVNDIKTLPLQAASALKLAHSELVDWLRRIPLLSKKSVVVDLPQPVEALKEDPAVQRAFAAHDLNVLSKAYYALSSEAVGATDYKTLDLDALNKILLLSPDLRAQERLNWIEERRSVLQREAHRAALAKIEEPQIKTRRKIETEAFSEEMIEYPFEQLIQKMQLHWAKGKKNEYNYHENPDLFYSHYLLQVQPLAEKLISEKILDEVFSLVEKNQTDLLRSKKILRALSDIDRTMISPLAHLNAHHVNPIVQQISVDAENKKQLSAMLLALSHAYSDDKATDLKNWFLQYQLIEPPVISYFIQASKQGQKLRDSMDSACSYFALEPVFDQAVIEPGIDPRGLLQKIDFLKNIPALRERVDLKIDEWQLAMSNRFLQGSLDQPLLIDTLSQFVDKVGTSAQKKAMQSLVEVKAAFLYAVDYLKALSNHESTVVAYTDVKAVLTALMKCDLKNSPGVVQKTMPLLLMRVQQLFSDKEALEDRAWSTKQALHAAVPRGGSMMAGAAIAATRLNSQESPNKKALQHLLSLVASLGSNQDKLMLIERAEAAHALLEKEHPAYAKAMYGMVSKTLNLNIANVATTAVSSQGLFGGSDDLSVLRRRYAAIAGDGWFADTGKMFKKNKTYLEIVQEMIDKVLKRSARDNKGSASFETLKWLKEAGYFEKPEVQKQLKQLDELAEKLKGVSSVPRP